MIQIQGPVTSFLNAQLTGKPIAAVIQPVTADCSNTHGIEGAILTGGKFRLLMLPGVNPCGVSLRAVDVAHIGSTQAVIALADVAVGQNDLAAIVVRFAAIERHPPVKGPGLGQAQRRNLIRQFPVRRFLLRHVRECIDLPGKLVEWYNHNGALRIAAKALPQQVSQFI